MRTYNMYNLRHFARVYRIAAPIDAHDVCMPLAAAASGDSTHDESVASMQAFGKMRTRGNLFPI
jgi:hypothetical protein